MTTVYRELSERIRGEVPDLDRLIGRVLHAWEGAQRSTDQQDVYLDSVALNLHGFYSGVERLFELIARHIDRDRELKTSESWHQDLLQRMKKDIQETRPALISDENASALDELWRFRHLMRNIYTLKLSCNLAHWNAVAHRHNHLSSALFSASFLAIAFSLTGGLPP